MKNPFLLLLVATALIGFNACSSAAINSVEITAPSTAKAGERVAITGIANPERGLSFQNNAVTWSIQSGPGSLADITKRSAVYLVPNLSASTTVVIRAPAEADPRKFQEATITLAP